MIPKGKVIALDTETTGLFPYGEFGARAFAVSFCNEEGDTGLMQWPVDPFTRMPKPREEDLRELRRFCSDKKITKVFFNAKFDIRMLKFWGAEVLGRVEDVFFMAKILRANEPSHGLKPLAKKYLGMTDEDQKELQQSVLKGRRLGKKNGWKIAEKGDDTKNPAAADYWLADPALLKKYAVQDAERTMLLYRILNEELDTAEAYRKFYERELVLLGVTMRMEDYGVRIRPSVVQEEIKKNTALMEDRLKKIQELTRPYYCTAKTEKKKREQERDFYFNPNSTSQVVDFVYKKLEFPIMKYTDTGNPAVDLEALKDMEHPVIHYLQEYKASEKAIASFFQKYASLSVPDDEGHMILHPSFNQIGPITGRYSCSNPNLQNVANATSVRAVAPIQARTPFCPRMGKEWYCFDYDSQEAWLFAAGAHEDVMLDSLLNGKDLHTETAEFIWGKEQVAHEFATVGKKKSLSRIRSKMLLYGIIYGMGIKKTAAVLGCSSAEAESTLNRYYTRFPRIKTFMDVTSTKAARLGYVETAWGRRIQVESDWAYRAVNYYVQGSAADMLKDAMISVDRLFQGLRIDAHVLMTVHDELIVEIAKKDVTQKLLNDVKSRMESHGGNLPAIPKIPCGMARVIKSWNLQEKVDLSLLPKGG